MKAVWYVQDHNSMTIDRVHTTKKSAFAEAKEYNKNGIFHKVCPGFYWFKPRKKDAEPYCDVVKVSVIHTKRPKIGDKKMKQKAFTLVEMTVVVAIIAILAVIVIKLAARIDNQGKEWRTRNAFALLDAALGEFQDYGYNYYKFPPTTPQDEIDFYRSLDFPLDCNGFDAAKLKDTLKKALKAEVSINGGVHEPNYSGSEVLYFFLRRIPESRKTLIKINKSLITSEDSGGNNMEISIDGKKYPLLRIVDLWGETLRYDYYSEDADTFEKMKESKRNFPVITSAGPDGIFGTDDDITNK